jgi:hypothetical protein
MQKMAFKTSIEPEASQKLKRKPFCNDLVILIEKKGFLHYA